MNKIQEFEVDGIDFSMQSTYHLEDKVWTANIEPYEWYTEKDMRMDMLIHLLSEDTYGLENWYQYFDCHNEEQIIEVYNKYILWLSKED